MAAKNVLFLLITLTFGSVFSQGLLTQKQENNALEKAEFYFHEEESKSIPKALKLFEQLSKNNP